MFIGIGLGLIPQAMTGSSVDALLGGNPLDLYGQAAFLFDAPRSTYRNGVSSTGDFSSLTGLTFTRALAAYAPNSAGVLQLFASGAPRITDRGLLIEGARTNLCLRSQEFDNASWTKTSCTVTADAIAAPDGTTTADKVVTNNAATNGRPQQVITTSAATAYTVSCFAKAGEWGFVTFRLAEDTAPAVWFNLNTGAVGTKDAGWSSASIQALGNGWYRCVATHTTVGTSYTYRFIPNNADNTASTGDGTSGIYLWGAQLEAAAFPSSYIPTTTASVARPADVCSIAVSGISYPATLFAEFERVVDTGGSEIYLALDDGSTNNESLVFVKSTDLAALQVLTSGATQADLSVAGAVAINTLTKAAGRIATNDAIIAKGGVLSSQDTSVTNPATPTTIRLGSRFGGSLVCFGFIKRAAVLSNNGLADGPLASWGA